MTSYFYFGRKYGETALVWCSLGLLAGLIMGIGLGSEPAQPCQTSQHGQP